jgi:hypothetical protein
MVGNSADKQPIGRCKHEWDDNTKRDRRDLGFCVVEWLDVAQNRDQWRVLVSAIICGKCLSSCTTDGVSRRSLPHGVTYTDIVVRLKCDDSLQWR